MSSWICDLHGAEYAQVVNFPNHRIAQLLNSKLTTDDIQGADLRQAIALHDHIRRSALSTSMPPPHLRMSAVLKKYWQPCRLERNNCF
jgi:hypothetical protein